MYTMTAKQSHLLDEICDKGRLEEYRGTLQKIIIMIMEKGCKISTRYDVHYSNIEENKENGYHIRVSLANSGEPLDIIWTLLHEYGHYLSGKKQPGDSRLQREQLAWTYADKLVAEFPQLSVNRQSYERCRQRCLGTYL